jgi:hypothetical protein
MSQISNLTEIRPLRSDLVRMDGQTYMTKLVGTFCDYANARKDA